MASPHAILTTLVGKDVRGKLLALLRDYTCFTAALCQGEVPAGREVEPQELENGTPQGGILSPFLFHLLMEQLVALPFHEDTTVLLSYADDLALVITGRGNKLRHRH